MYRNIKPHYFSIDAIMAAQEKIQCSFIKKVEHVGKFLFIYCVIQLS